MSKSWAILAIALWLLVAVAMNTALVGQEKAGPTIPVNDPAETF